MALPGQYGAFTNTTQVWDVSDIYSKNLDPKLTELLVRMYQNLNIMANILNVKDTGQYNNSFESVNGQLWFPNPALTSASTTNAVQRQVFRKVINFGVLPNASSKSVAHNIPITSGFTFTRIYATSSDTTNLDYIPIPYASAINDNIELSVNATDVTITTNSASWITYTITYVILEFIKF